MKDLKHSGLTLTLISLINVEPTLTDFEKFPPSQNKNPPSTCIEFLDFSTLYERYTYRVLQTIQMKLILLWVWAERAVLGRAKTALKFK